MLFPAALVKMRQMEHIFKSNFLEFYDSFDAWKIHCGEHHSNEGFSSLAMYNDLPRQEVSCWDFDKIPYFLKHHVTFSRCLKYFHDKSYNRNR